MPAAEPTGPIRDRELPALLAPIAEASRVALAISGGSDSLALLDCVDRWRRGRSKAPALLVLSVDHGLRKSSSSDSARVVELARMRGIEAKALLWSGPKPRSDIEAVARRARYGLLLGAARAFDASHLLLGHHLDDQAETLLLRLARGSGVFGLAAMRRELCADGLTIFRPFLGLSRSRLAETVAAAGLMPVEDPMNTDPRFARGRLRRIMPLIAADGMEPVRLAATARRLSDAAEAIDAAASELIARAIELDAMAAAAIEPKTFFSAPGEIRRRSLSRLLLAIGGGDYAPRYERLAALARSMAQHDGGRFKRTLAGAIIEWRSGRFVVYREIGREGLPRISANPGFCGVWDGRFHIKIGSDAPSGLRLAELGDAGRHATGARAGGRVAAGSLAALPALWRGGALKAVPGLDFFSGAAHFEIECRSVLSERLAAPPLFPDFLATM